VLARIFSSSAAVMISEVWTWESVQHGDSGLVNAKALTGFCEYLFFFLLDGILISMLIFSLPSPHLFFKKKLIGPTIVVISLIFCSIFCRRFL